MLSSLWITQGFVYSNEEVLNANLAHLLLFYFRILFTYSFVVWGGIFTFFFVHFFKGFTRPL